MSQLVRLGRLAESSLLVLVALAEGPKHGYAVQGDVARFSGVKLGPGTLYVILPRLERLGLIEPMPSDDRRRPYRLTRAGRDLLRGELERTGVVARMGLKRLAKDSA